MKTLVVRSVSAVVTVTAIVAAVLYSNWSPAVPSHRPSALVLAGTMRTPEQHDLVRSENPGPYILTFGSGSGRLVFYGAHHTGDRNDPQFSDIERHWRELRPTVALYEGRRRGFFVGPLFGLDGVSEAGWVHQLARRDGVRLMSLEPAYEDEVQVLLQTWPAEKVALYFFTRVYWSEAGGEADDALALELLAKRTDVRGLRGELATLARVTEIWNRDYPAHGDWRTRRGEMEEGYLYEIALASRRIRGEHMARTLIELTRSGERVFAVAGSGHPIRLEPVLRRAFP